MESLQRKRLTGVDLDPEAIAQRLDKLFARFEGNSGIMAIKAAAHRFLLSEEGECDGR